MSAERNFIDALKDGPKKAMWSICDNYTDFSKDQLRKIIVEFIYALANESDVLEEVAETLESDWYYFLESEE